MIVHVDLGEHGYPIYIGDGVLNDLASIIRKHCHFEKLFIITDHNVEKLHAATFVEALQAGHYTADILSVPAGENSKSLQCANGLYTKLIQGHANRQSMIIAFGGGVIGDLAGFVAATFMRGVAFAQVPTTILAQVDSSVGGKVGINHTLGKNLIGAFYQPSFVLADPVLLKTCDLRQRRAGLAEVIKYSLIRDRDLFYLLSEQMQKLISLTDSQTLEHVLAVCCQIKADIVAQDEKEQGLRAILNFGHTLGHALEAATHYEVFLHGEAVLHGMRAALHLSHLNGNLGPDTLKSALSLLEVIKPPAIPGEVKADSLWKAIQYDKKQSQKGQQWVLLQDIGEAFFTRQIPRDLVEDSIEYMLAS
jgi:3-dehydroquinate synthase